MKSQESHCVDGETDILATRTDIWPPLRSKLTQTAELQHNYFNMHYVPVYSVVCSVA